MPQLVLVFPRMASLCWAGLSRGCAGACQAPGSIPCPSHDPVPKWLGPDPRSSGRRGSGPDGVAGVRVLAPRERHFLREPELASLPDLRSLLHLEQGWRCPPCCSPAWGRTWHPLIFWAALEAWGEVHAQERQSQPQRDTPPPWTHPPLYLSVHPAVRSPTHPVASLGILHSQLWLQGSVGGDSDTAPGSRGLTASWGGFFQHPDVPQTGRGW